MSAILRNQCLRNCQVHQVYKQMLMVTIDATRQNYFAYATDHPQCWRQLVFTRTFQNRLYQEILHNGDFLLRIDVSWLSLTSALSKTLT